MSLYVKPGANRSNMWYNMFYNMFWTRSKMLDGLSIIFNEIYYVWRFAQIFNMLYNICPTFEFSNVRMCDVDFIL